jgi:hypothetical protein
MYLPNKFPLHLVICPACGNVFLYDTYISFERKNVCGKSRLKCPYCDNHKRFLHSTIEESGEFIVPE